MPSTVVYDPKTGAPKSQMTYGPEIPAGFNTPYAIGSASGGGLMYSDGSVRYASTGGYSNTPTNNSNVLGASDRNVAPSYSASAPASFNPTKDDINAPQWSAYRQSLADQAKSERDAALARITPAINSTYSAISGRLDSMLNGIPGQQQEDTQRLNDSILSRQQGIDNSYQSTLDKIDTYKTDINNDVKKKSANIASDLQSLLNASYDRLGMVGAGNSSAARVMLPFALGKQAARAGSQVAQEAVSQTGDLQRKALDAKSVRDQAMGQIEQDRLAQQQSIVDRFRELKMRIDEAKNTADERKLAALNAIDVSLLSAAQNKLDTIEAETRNYAQQIDQWYRERSAASADQASSIQGYGNYSVTPLSYTALTGMGDVQGMNAANDFYNPYALIRKQDNTTL